MVSQITNLKIVYTIIHSGADERRYQISASLAFVRGIHRSPVNSPHKWPVTRKMLPFDDVIMGKGLEWDPLLMTIFWTLKCCIELKGGDGKESVACIAELVFTICFYHAVISVDRFTRLDKSSYYNRVPCICILPCNCDELAQTAFIKVYIITGSHAFALIASLAIAGVYRDHIKQNIFYISNDTWSCKSSFSSISAIFHTDTHVKGHDLFIWFLFNIREHMLSHHQCRKIDSAGQAIRVFKGVYHIPILKPKCFKSIHMHSFFAFRICHIYICILARVQR